jgi:hypothetical protein
VGDPNFCDVALLPVAEGDMVLTIKRIFAIAVPLGLPLSERTLGQEQSPQKIISHVTAVRSEEAQD